MKVYYKESLDIQREGSQVWLSVKHLVGEIWLYLYCKSYLHVAPAVALKTSVNAILHHGNKLLVAQEAVPVVVKYLENWKSAS